MSVEMLTLIMFGILLLVLFMGLPLSFALGGVAAITAYFLWSPAHVGVLVQQTFKQSVNFILLAVPLFIVMGILLESSGIGKELYDAFYKWAGRFRGGLAIATILVCTVLAACTGITAPATVMMGVVALPSMLERGYDKKLAMGSIMGAGTLSILIPPSVPMVILSQAGGPSVGSLFMGGLIPGLVMSVLFVLYVILVGIVNPRMCPASSEYVSWAEKLAALKSLVLPVILVVVVLGFIFLGITTPTEAAAFGAFGALLIVLARRKVNWTGLKEVCRRTLVISGMAFWIIFGAACFTSIFNTLGGLHLVDQIMQTVTIGRWGIFMIFGIILIFLGMFLDQTGIIMISAPFMFPVIKQLGFDPVWFGIIFVILMMVGYLSPPFGYNLFYLKAVSPETPMTVIFESSIPWMVIMLVCVGMLVAFPSLVTWLPSMMITR